MLKKLQSDHSFDAMKQRERKLNKLKHDIQQDEEKQVANMIMNKMETIKSTE